MEEKLRRGQPPKENPRTIRISAKIDRILADKLELIRANREKTSGQRVTGSSVIYDALLEYAGKKTKKGANNK